MAEALQPGKQVEQRAPSNSEELLRLRVRELEGENRLLRERLKEKEGRAEELLRRSRAAEKKLQEERESLRAKLSRVSLQLG